MTSRPKLSGIQRQVLALYRGFLRTARLKAPEERHRIESVVSAEFRDNARNVDRRNFVCIEYLLRRGKRQLEQLKNPDITGLATLEVKKGDPYDCIVVNYRVKYCLCRGTGIFVSE
ncbi:succinate dehydrogenase assembly factor 1, mitochondrial [Setaria viridis]|uniref:succinate dehydrogenase assembly factor 1, mitochondrial n=1 Tax=Setaria viridis TaxID=4556 RepID=UPI001493B309|nr:succinate dehydrogenase assembly factor 1, mitochondrial [Setaria viridis]